MEFGMFHEFPSLPGRSDTEAFDEGMAQVDAAERYGLDAMWLAEIHFAPERTHLSAPLPIAAAIAARTSHMKIGIAVQVLPLCHPLRLAEEAATVDQLSRGRLIFGVGRSGVVSTYDAYQVPYDESRDRFVEILDIVKTAWTEDRFSYKGRFHSFENVRVVPKPYQKPLPEIRIAASTPDTFPAIGALGYPVFASTRHPTWTRSGAAHQGLLRRLQGGRPSRQRPGLRVRTDLYRRDRGAGARRGAGKRHPFLPAAIRADRRIGAPLRPAEFHRPRREIAHPDL